MARHPCTKIDPDMLIEYPPGEVLKKLVSFLRSLFGHGVPY